MIIYSLIAYTTQYMISYIFYLDIAQKTQQIASNHEYIIISVRFYSWHSISYLLPIFNSINIDKTYSEYAPFYILPILILNIPFIYLIYFK